MTTSTKAIPVTYSPLSAFKSEAQQNELARYMETFKGRVLAVTGETGDWSHWDDYGVYSHVRLIVWNPAKGQAEQYVVYSRPYRYDSIPSPFEVDASPEYQAAYAKWYAETYLPPIVAQSAKWDVGVESRKLSERIGSIQSDIQRGSLVTVVRGRKYAHGLTGKAFWMGQDKFGGTKVGVALSDRKDGQGRNADVMWIALGNLSKVLSPEEQSEVNELEARIKGIMASEAERAAHYTAQYAVPGSHQNYALAAVS